MEPSLTASDAVVCAVEHKHYGEPCVESGENNISDFADALSPSDLESGSLLVVRIACDLVSTRAHSTDIDSRPIKYLDALIRPA